MVVKAYIAALSIVITETIRQACHDMNIEPVVMRDLKHLVHELKEAKPSIIFLQASIVEESEDSIITLIKSDEVLGEAYIIINAVRLEGAEFAYQVGADAFLPIPFSQPQLESILRHALNLPKKILLIGSTSSDNSTLYAWLVSSGFQVTCAKDGHEGISCVKNQFPDMILSDLEVPDFTGYELCKTIKSSKLFIHIPFVILSDKSDVATIEMCFESGAHDILMPPYESKDNLKKITSIVSPARSRKEKALVVDDSIVVRNLISKMLKQLGFFVLTASDGAEGLKVALREKPDIITSDYDMPVMDGWEFCTELKKNEQTTDIPVIMITSRTSETDIKKAQLLGVSGYLPKPFSIQDLQESVKKSMVESRIKKEQKTLAKYIAVDTLTNVRDLIEQGKDIETKEKFITILFSDICGFSTKCEQMDPKQIVLLLNNYFQCMVDVLLAHQAIIDKFIGDAIVARFDSGDHRQDALNAVRSTIAMLDALPAFNKTSFENISVRIGISTGNVILGNIGCDKHRLDYTMIGDKVNIAERLQHQAQPQGCLLSDTTYELTREYIDVGDMLELSVKGKSELVKAYPLLGLKK